MGSETSFQINTFIICAHARSQGHKTDN